jgi:hypothetical protein
VEPQTPHGANAALADGSARRLPTETPSSFLRALLTANGNEPVDGDALDD